jgi:sphinganine-1-phosphate aldolase
MDEAKLHIENKLVPKGADVVRHLSLPDKGKTPDWIFGEMQMMDTEVGNVSWRHGKLSGAVYRTSSPPLCFPIFANHLIDGGEELEKVIVAAYERYCVSNPIHPDVFPAIRKMEAEIVAMCLKMYNNPDGAGTMTSGGTESIIMAIKTHRDWAHAVKGITEPEMCDIPLVLALLTTTVERVYTVLSPPRHMQRSIKAHSTSRSNTT